MKCLTESISKMNRSTGNDIGYAPFIDLIWVQPERRGSFGSIPAASRCGVLNQITVPAVMPERFVDARAAGEFLGLHAITVQRLARKGALPSHPVSAGAKVRWRFLLSELGEWLRSRRN
jgi:predicted DNA-binding transcriptional regulator AlpA